MSLPGDIFNALKGLVDERVFHEQIPQDNKAWPAIYYSVSGTPQNTLEGASDQDRFRVEINVVARSTSEIWGMRQRVFDAMEFSFESAERIADMPMPYDDAGALFRRVIEFYVYSE